MIMDCNFSEDFFVLSKNEVSLAKSKPYVNYYQLILHQIKQMTALVEHSKSCQFVGRWLIK